MKKLAYILATLIILLLPNSAFSIEPDETGLKTGGESLHNRCWEVNFHRGERTFI